MELKKIITEHPNVLNNVAMFKGILLDTYNQPENKGKINLLLNAYEIHITDEIAQNDLDDVFVERMKKKLVSTYSVTDNSAEWAIKTWCSEYGNGILGKEIGFSAFVTDDEVDEITTPNTAPVIENSKQLVLKDGTLYEGAVFADIPHGYGEAEYKNGDVYKGYWNRGQRSGQGILLYENGSEWTGEFKDDKFWNGTGYKRFNDSVYEGEWKNGKENGQGKLIWDDGGEWIGEFEDGKRWNGSGIDRYKGNTYYDGPLIAGLRNGFGKFYYNDAIYEGEWRAGEKNGQGKTIWNEGGEWVGEFKDDQRWNGKGIERYSDGEFFEGELANGKRNGFGKHHCADSIVECAWENDRVKGQGKIIWHKGGEWTGEFKDGRRWNGQGVVHHESGDRYEGTTAEGERNGFGKYVWNDGTVYEGEWQNGKKHGKGKLVRKNGDELEGNFVNDYLSKGTEYIKSQNKTRFLSNGQESYNLVGDHRPSGVEALPEPGKGSFWGAFIITTLFYLLSIHIFKSNYPEYEFNSPFNFYSAFPFVVPIAHAIFSGILAIFNKLQTISKNMASYAGVSVFIMLFLYLILALIFIVFRDLGDEEVFNTIKGLGLWCTRIDWAITSFFLWANSLPNNN